MVPLCTKCDYYPPADVRKRTSLASLLLSAGEKAIEAAAEASPLQIKTLLFGMGEVFQALVFEKAEN